MNPDILVIYRVADEHLRRFAEHFTIHYHPDLQINADDIRQIAPRIRGVITNGSVGIDSATIEMLPALEIVACVGAGYEKVDVQSARAKGIQVTYGLHTNDLAVADHAMALLLAIARGLHQADSVVRGGGWLQARTIRSGINRKRLGILGLGSIGREIARRASGFDMEIGYHNRRPVDDVPYAYVPTLVELARNSDFLMISAPGGQETRGLVNEDVLQALGAEGYLVNVGRGSIVSNDALTKALRHGAIAGAALDVVEGEPNVPIELRTLPNVLITPHIAGFSREAYAAMVQLVIDNLAAHFDRQPLLTPVP